MKCSSVTSNEVVVSEFVELLTKKASTLYVIYTGTTIHCGIRMDKIRQFHTGIPTVAVASISWSKNVWHVAPNSNKEIDVMNHVSSTCKSTFEKFCWFDSVALALFMSSLCDNCKISCILYINVTVWFLLSVWVPKQ